MIKAPESWMNLEKDCQLAHSCSEYQMSYAVSRRDKKLQKKIERERADISRVTNAVKDSLLKNPDQSVEELTKSVIAILTPWLIRLIGSYFISQFQNKILEWILNRIKVNPV